MRIATPLGKARRALLAVGSLARIAVGSLALIASSAPAEEVYRCKRADGTIGFQDRPCADPRGQARVELPKAIDDRSWRVRGRVEQGERPGLYPHGLALFRDRPHRFVLHLTAHPIDANRLAALRAMRWKQVGPLISVYLDRAAELGAGTGPCELSAITAHIDAGDAERARFVGGASLRGEVDTCEIVEVAGQLGVRFALLYDEEFRLEVGGTFPVRDDAAPPASAPSPN